MGSNRCYQFYDHFFKIVVLLTIMNGSFCALPTLSDIKNTLNLNPLQLPGIGGGSGSSSNTAVKTPTTPCTCAVFLSGQFIRGSPEPPTGNPALVHEQDKIFSCTPAGLKQCQAKCLETFLKMRSHLKIVRHLPNSADILCATIDRDCHKERAYLFIQNCEPKWHNTNLSAGREYCCKDGLPYQCPIK